MKRSVLWTRSLSRCRARMSWWIVGTDVYHVGRCEVRRRRKPTGLKRGGSTTVPPDAKVDSVQPISPCTWKSGITQSEVSSGERPYVDTVFRAEATRLRCL